MMLPLRKNWSFSCLCLRRYWKNCSQFPLSGAEIWGEATRSSIESTWLNIIFPIPATPSIDYDFSFCRTVQNKRKRFPLHWTVQSDWQRHLLLICKRQHLKKKTKMTSCSSRLHHFACVFPFPFHLLLTAGSCALPTAASRAASVKMGGWTNGSSEGGEREEQGWLWWWVELRDCSL